MPNLHQGKYAKTNSIPAIIPETPKKQNLSPWTAETIQQKAKELFESLNLFASNKETMAEILRLDEKNKQLFEDINKRLAEMKWLMPAIKVQK